MQRSRTASAALLFAAVGLAPAGCRTQKVVHANSTVDTFTQSASNQNTLNFAQTPAQIDVLFVVDNSPSMCEKQQQLASKFTQFISVLQSQNLDFQIGVATTDFGNSKFQGKLVAQNGNPFILTPSTPNLPQVFSQNVAAVGLNGSAQSQGLLAGLAAVTLPLTQGANTGFVRTTASLAVIIVSDEDDLSLAPPPTPPQSDYYINYFIRSFDFLKGGGNENLVSVSVITGADTSGAPADCPGAGTAPPGTSCTFVDTSGHAGTRYAAVATGTGGLVQSICATDFGPLLQTLANHLGGLTHTVDLSEVPSGSILDPNTLTITVTPANGQSFTIPQDPNNGWSYDAANQAISFRGSGVPPPSSKVAILYALLQRAFPLSSTPQLGTVTVTVTTSGTSVTIPQTTNDATLGWSYDSSKNAITFGSAQVPPAGSTIDVSYDF